MKWTAEEARLFFEVTVWDGMRKPHNWRAGQALIEAWEAEKKRNAKLERVAEEARHVAKMLVCYCGPEYLDRGRHAPNCDADEADDMREALAALEETP